MGGLICKQWYLSVHREMSGIYLSSSSSIFNHRLEPHNTYHVKLMLSFADLTEMNRQQLIAVTSVI